MLKKLKAFYKKNRVYSILMLISITCIIAILAGVLIYFFTQTSKDVYGNRLEGIEDVKITDTKKDEVLKNIESNEKVSEVEFDIRGRLVYVIISLKEGTHADAEAIAQGSLETFGEEIKAYYDIQFIVENKSETEENFPVMGYLKAGNSVIKWTNYVVK